MADENEYSVSLRAASGPVATGSGAGGSSAPGDPFYGMDDGMRSPRRSCREQMCRPRTVLLTAGCLAVGAVLALIVLAVTGTLTSNAPINESGGAGPSAPSRTTGSRRPNTGASPIPEVTEVTGDQVPRQQLAAQVIGLNMAFLEAQRAGPRPDDADTTAPQIWSWKRPAFTEVCSTFISKLTPAQLAEVQFQAYPGHFEAGGAVTATLPEAFAATQQALGMLHFEEALANRTAEPIVTGDPARCLPEEYAAEPVTDRIRRELRYTANALAAAIIVSSPADTNNFKIITGVGDNVAFDFNTAQSATWQIPSSIQDRCYVGDANKPAADVAAQTAAALALLAKWFNASPGSTDDDKNVLAPMLAEKARRAYAYAKAMEAKWPKGATCSHSGAKQNCVGNCTLKPVSDELRQPCELYYTKKTAVQRLFVAAAALYWFTNDPSWRIAADNWYEETSDKSLFYSNWDNTVAQGVTIMASNPFMDNAVPGATPREKWQTLLRNGAKLWSDCSNDGSKGDFCKRTPDGKAYPLDIPWGNNGASLSAICMSAIYQNSGLDTYDNNDMKGARCFMQRELGYITNHKCNRNNASYTCNTNTPEGWSYIVGLGANFPNRLHSRDAAGAAWISDTAPDKHTLCGAVVSGPFVDPGLGPVPPDRYDLYNNERSEYQETEAAVDYSGGLICAFGGYAALPSQSFDHCQGIRGPLTGRKT